MNGDLFFSACTFQSGCVLWKTDGTRAGTVRVATVAPPRIRSQAYAWSLFYYALGGIVVSAVIGGLNNAHGPRPAVAALDDGLRTLKTSNYRGRDEAYKRSRLSLTEFGKAIVAHKEDFSRHNPIDRWWGGTRLTNDRLWRWNPALVKP